MAAATVATIFLCGLATAQNTPGAHQDNGGINGSLSHDDLEKLGGARAADPNADAARPSAAARAKARKQSEPLLESLHISCAVRDAQLVVSGTRRPVAGGKEVEARVYEVACDGGSGYLIETQGAEPPLAISCRAAEAARAEDVAAGKKPGFYCRLAGNRETSSGTGRPAKE